MENEILKVEDAHLPSNNLIEFWLTVIMSGVRERDVEYFEGDTFEEHYDLIPSKYFANALGVSQDELDFESVRDFIIERIQDENR